MSQFRVAYSNLVKAIWQDPTVQAKVTSKPALLKHFGFDHIPSSVDFKSASGPEDVSGFQNLESSFAKATTNFTFYVPPKPAAGTPAAAAVAGTASGDACCCCSCCPCCTCT